MKQAYQLIRTILEQQRAQFNAAEAHGIAAGMLCVDSNVAVLQWLQELLEDINVFDQENHSLLVEFFEQTRKLLDGKDEQFAFDLLLPDENEALPVRAEGIRQWCQGFLYGFGKSHEVGYYSEECNEILRDLVEITKLDTRVENDEDEMALMEIHEYIRSAVLLLRDHLYEHRSRRQH